MVSPKKNEKKRCVYDNRECLSISTSASTAWGYGFTQILGGVAADRLGGARVLLVGLGMWSLAVTAIPAASTLTSAPVAMLVVGSWVAKNITIGKFIYIQ